MMKLEKRANDIVNALVAPKDRLVPDDVEFVLGQLRAAVEAEREACALVCDGQAQDVIGEWYGNEDYRRGAAKSARLIRARGTVT